MPSRRAAVSLPVPLAALLLSAAPAAAQVEDRQLWEQVNLVVPLTPEVRVTLEQIGRWGDRIEGLTQTELGGVLGYKLSDTIELGVGYRHVGLYSASGPTVHENRLRQQVVLTHGRLIGRLRVDERFNPGGSEIGFRIRPLARYNHPLGSRGYALYASHESFIVPNSTAWGQRSGYERMRNMAGVTLPFVRRKVMLDVGYLNQYRLGLGGARPQMEHALSLQLTINALGPILHD
ncbi:DUF2490 domain-containing protein [Sphingomonas sp. BK580]|uniref:DUF2490 domain-containing protein n=1 Tax=Sphingomonas sp. BK580 TaxID=2586972 RepID=UPI0017F2F89C|nr:DUF2490 domain-containing protein [Sphingomonas sp. BK580]MBB3695053.1 hypothetical protein [Sphingomonas sp. BK580]